MWRSTMADIPSMGKLLPRRLPRTGGSADLVVTLPAFHWWVTNHQGRPGCGPRCIRGRDRFMSSSSKGSHRKHLVRQNAEQLRSMREPEEGRRAAPKVTKNIDYRYRNGGRAPKSVSTFWGGEEAKDEELDRQRRRKKQMRSGLKASIQEEEQHRQQQQTRPFVSFFDEVDAIMKEKYGYGRVAAKPTLLDILVDPSLSRDQSARSNAATLLGRTDTLSSKSFRSKASQSSSSVVQGRKSIFDVLPASVMQPRKEHAYERNSFEQYQIILQHVIERMDGKKGFTEAVVDWLKKDERTIPYTFTVIDEVIERGGTISEKDCETGARPESVALNKQFDIQREKFLEAVPFAPKEYQQARTALKVVADMCVKRARAAPIEIVWEKAKEAGIILSEAAMNTFLYVVSTGGLGLTSSMSNALHSYLLPHDSMQGNRSGSILDTLGNKFQTNSNLYADSGETSNGQKERRDIREEVSIFRDILYDPTERSVCVRINSMIARGDPEGAEALLKSFEASDGDIRLRTFLPLLKYYWERADVSRGLFLFKKMRGIPTVFLEPETYVLLISTVAENGFFRTDADPIKGSQELGYTAPSGPQLLDELLVEMSEDVLEITSASARRLYNAFAIGFRGHEMAKNLKEMHSLAGMAPDNAAADDGELIASRVTVDEKTGICPRSGATLRLIMLEHDQRKQLCDSLLVLSKTAYEQAFEGRRHKANLRSEAEWAAQELWKFSQWLDTREGDPFTAIVDGANVAYYMQNFDYGRFNYHQIQFVVDALLSMNENPLVIIPYKYTHSTFSVSTGFGGELQRLSSKEKAILEDLTRQGRLWKVPPRCMDDYYWMLASVSDQTASRKGADLGVLPNNDEGRWPGTRPILVSNDQMRDHKLELIEPRLYRRWCSCHIVNFNFTAFVENECVDEEIGFSTPDFFSREIQGNPTPGEGGTAWHFPVSDWDLNERFCVRIPRRVE